MKTNEKLTALWYDCHTTAGLNRLTVRQACDTYGRRLVRAAMNRGQVYATNPQTFEFCHANPDSKLQANGQRVG